MLRRLIRRAVRRALRQERPADAPAASARASADIVREPLPPPEEEVEVEVEAETLATWVQEEGREVLFLDIREPHEVMQTHLRDALLIPMNQVPGRLAELPREQTIIVYCAAGARSFGVAHWLREQGLEDSWSLVGGLGAWIEVGGAYEQPSWEVELRPTRPVRLTDAAAQARGLGPDARQGTVQAVRVEDGQVRVTVDVMVDGARRRLEGLDQAEVEEPPPPRRRR